MKQRIVFLVTFAAISAAIFLAAPSQAQPETVKQILPGVWFREGDLMHLGHCNNIIIEMKDNLIRRWQYRELANGDGGGAEARRGARAAGPRPIWRKGNPRRPGTLHDRASQSRGDGHEARQES